MSHLADNTHVKICCGHSYKAQDGNTENEFSTSVFALLLSF